MNKGTAIVGFILSFIAGMILVWGIGRGSSSSTSAKAEDREKAAGRGAAADGASGGVGLATTPNAGAVKVELFVMSQCPYGVQAEAAFEEVVKKMGADIDFHVDFIAQKKEGQWASMHGPKEMKGDIVQVCAQKYAPGKWFDLVLCQNKNYKEVDTNWDGCSRDLGIDAGKLASCVDGPEGTSLVNASFERSQAAKASGSPTILINGEKYQGGRRAGDIMRAVCAKFTNGAPASCADIPEAPKVNVTLLTDARCKECNAKQLEGSVRQKVANPVLSTLDYADPAGKKLYDSIKPVMLPALVFDSSLDGDKEASAALARGLKPAGSYKVMASGGWNPACADDGGCGLDECKATLQCRAEVPNKLEVFVMSQCPFGVKGLDAMKEVLENFKKNNVNLDFQVNFIGGGDAKGLTSMHGQGEVDEDIREACAIKHYSENMKFMDYVWCRNKSIKDANWQACTGGETGIDTDTIKKCFEGDEGKDLLAKSFEYSKSTGFGASPTWLVNNKYKFSGVDAQTIKTNICNHNQLAGCDATLSGPPPRPTKAGGAPAAEPGCGG